MSNNNDEKIYRINENPLNGILPVKSNRRVLRKHRMSAPKMDRDYFPGFMRPPIGKNRGIHRTRCKSHIKPNRD